MMATPEIDFLDLKNYLEPNYLLALFLEHYGMTKSKGRLPYEMVKFVSDLSKPGLPSCADFYSTLRGENILAEAYNVVEPVWRSNEMHTLFDLLRWYSLLDVQPFLEAVLVYLIQYKERGVRSF